jgi:hypothetical protein
VLDADIAVLQLSARNCAIWRERLLVLAEGASCAW